MADKTYAKRLTGSRAIAAAFVAGIVMQLAAVPVAAEIFYYRLQLSGGATGDADGAAHGTLSVDSETGRIVWGLYYSNIEVPSAMHIHRGAAGEGGGVIVPLDVESKLGAGALTGSVSAEADAVAEILSSPASFYVNLHTADFPRGALRAQLGDEWSARN